MILNASPREDVGLPGTATREMICSTQRGRGAAFLSERQTAGRGEKSPEDQRGRRSTGVIGSKGLWVVL